ALKRCLRLRPDHVVSCEPSSKGAKSSRHEDLRSIFNQLLHILYNNANIPF
ncbi:hypothetical protein HAX54_014379, partial [Datura stramonium]|nr:hypothetical protein [Datura stramonium]